MVNVREEEYAQVGGGYCSGEEVWGRVRSGRGRILQRGGSVGGEVCGGEVCAWGYRHERQALEKVVHSIKELFDDHVIRDG